MNYNATVKSLISIYQRKWGYRQRLALERVKRLEKQGVIMGYRALLNPELLDAPLLVIVEITLVRGKPDVFEEFNAAIQALDEILECHLVSGDFDYLLKTRGADMAAYRKLLEYHLITFTRCE